MSDWGNHNGSVRYLSSMSTTIEQKKKSKCIESSWMTVNSNWSLMDNSCFKWNVFNKGSWHLKIIRIWFIYQKVRFVKDVLLFTRNFYRSWKIYRTNTSLPSCNLNNTNWLPYLVTKREKFIIWLISFSLWGFVSLQVLTDSIIDVQEHSLFSILSFLLFS